MILAMLAVEPEHFPQGELRAHISIHEEKCSRTARQDLVTKVIDPATCTQGGKLLQVPLVKNYKKKIKCV